MLGALIRVALQLALVGLMVIYYPVAVVIMLGGMYMLANGNTDDLLKLSEFILGVIGLTALFISIALTDAAIRRKWARRLLTPGLACGVVAALLIAYGADSRGPIVPKLDWWSLYLLGGPLVVAVWNGWRMWRSLGAPRTVDNSAA